MKVTRTLVAILLFGACTSGTSESRHKWEAAEVNDYRWKVSSRCFGPCGTIVATVVDGEPVSWRYLASTGGPRLDLTDEDLDDWSFPSLTVEGLFDEIDETESEAIEVEFDEALGYPIHIFFDYVVDAIDDEVTYSVEFLRTS
jgi:hypothetical protein